MEGLALPGTSSFWKMGLFVLVLTGCGSAVADCQVQRVDPATGSRRATGSATINSMSDNNVAEYVYDSSSGAMWLIESWYDPNPDLTFADSTLVEYQSDEEFAAGAMMQSPSISSSCGPGDGGGLPITEFPPVTTSGRVPMPHTLPPAGLVYFYRIAGRGFGGRNVIRSTRSPTPTSEICQASSDHLRFAEANAFARGMILSLRPNQDFIVANADGSEDTWTVLCGGSGCGSVVLKDPARVPCTPPRNG